MSSFWSTLLGVLVGGGISAAVVWWVTPAVSKRERREERREDALAQLQVVAQSKLQGIPGRLRLWGTQMALVSDFQGWKQRADLPPIALEEVTDDRFRRQNDEIERCVNIMLNDCETLVQEIQSLPMWLSRIGETDELRKAWNQLSNATTKFNLAFFEPTLLQKVNALRGVQADWLPQIEEAIAVLATWSLQQLGHDEPARQRRLFRLKGPLG